MPPPDHLTHPTLGRPGPTLFPWLARPEGLMIIKGRRDNFCDLFTSLRFTIKFLSPIMATMSDRFDEVVAIMARLRGDGGCPWDRKQTRESLKSYLIEEAYEVLETIDAQDDRKLKEELGDVLLQILFHAEIGRERKTFTIEDVLQTLAEKLIRRHPHVFSESPSDPITAAEVIHRWEEIKQHEKAQQ